MNGNRYCEAAIVCGGNINDPGICLYLAKVKRDLQKILHADRDELQIQKVERWNSVRVTFRLPHNAVQRLRLLAEKNPEALRSLGILSVQVDGIVTRNVVVSSASTTTTAASAIAASVAAVAAAAASTSSASANNVVVPSSLNNSVVISNINNNNNFTNSSTSSVFNNSINNTSTIQQHVATTAANANSYNAVAIDPSVSVVRRTAGGIIRHTVPQQQQQPHQYHQGQAPTTSNCYAPPPQQQSSSTAFYANYQQQQQQQQAAAMTYNQAQPQPPPSHHQQQQRARINSAAHYGTNIVNTSVSSSNVAGSGPPNSSPLLVNLLSQHSPPPAGAPQAGSSTTMVVQQQQSTTAAATMINEQPPPAKKRKKPAKQKNAQQSQAMSAAASTSAAYGGSGGGCLSDVQVTNYSSQANLVLAPPPIHHQQPSAHHQHPGVAPPPPFHPSTTPSSAMAAANQMRQQQQHASVYSNFLADGDSQAVAHHTPIPSRADRDATISSAIDSVVSRVSMPPITPTDAQVQQQQQQNIQHHWINEDKVIGHSGHVDGAVSDLSNVHQSSAMFDAVMSPTVPTHHPLHTNRITTPTNHIPESQHHQVVQQQQQQQSSSSYYGNVVDPSSPFVHHMAPPPQSPHLPPSSSSSPWSHTTPLQHQQQQFLQQQQSFNVRPPCSLPIQQTPSPQTSSSTPASHLHQQQQQHQMQQDLHHSNVWLSPPPSYGAVCHVTNLAVHSQTKVNNPPTSSSMLVNGDDQNVVGVGGPNVWARHHQDAVGAASSNDVAAVLNCHDSEHRWIEQPQQSDHDYLSDGLYQLHHQQNLNLINSSPGDYVLHTATATASAVVTSGTAPNPLFKTTNQSNPSGQWNSFGLQNVTDVVQDTFIHDNGGGDIHPASVGRPPSQWHSMPSFDGTKTSVGMRTSAPNANSPVLPPENMIRFSPG